MAESVSAPPESEASNAVGAPAAEEGDGDAPGDAPGEPARVAKQEEEPEPSARDGAKPSYTLRIRGLPADLDMSDLEMRLARFGDVVSVTPEEGMVVAKFSRTTDAYKAREKLNGASPYGEPLQVEFGPQDVEHYNRGKKRQVGRGRKEFLDSGMTAEVGGPKANASKKKGGGLRAWQDGEGATRVKALPDDEAAAGRRGEGPSRPPGPGLNPPAKPVSRWSPDLAFEQQLEDFMKMPRRGMYNRYLVLGKLPPELRTGEAIWRAMVPVQRDIVQIEMLTCFNKPVAHIALRSATAAAAMHRLCEQMHPGLTVAFAPPRRASATLWLGNIDDFVPRKELETLLGEYGRVVNGLRYLPARTCAFASFSQADDAVAARNYLYGMEVQKNQYLNIDFVDEGDGGYAADGWGGAAWPTPWAPQWGPWGGWGGAGAGRRPPGAEWGRPGARSPPRLQLRAGRRRSRTRSRGRGSDREPSEPPVERQRKKKARRAAESPQKVSKKARAAPASDAESEAPVTKGEAKAAGKAKVKLYKMGEFCCNIVANFVKGKDTPELLVSKLHIDQRTKIDHCKSHLDRAGKLGTIWHFSAADRKDCAAYDALCDYFVEKQRVGLVQTPSYYVYIVPPTEKYLSSLGLQNSNFMVGLQIPIKK